MNPVEIQSRGHHPYSPSSLQMREACPMWASAHSDSEASLRGTLQHLAVERGEDLKELSDEEADAVSACCEFLDGKRAQLALLGTYEELVEVYLPIDDECREVVVFDAKTEGISFQKVECTTGGYVDRLLIGDEGRFVVMADWKFGKWPVEEVENNLQAVAYTLGVFRKFPKAEKVEATFFLPHQERKQITHTFVRADIPTLELRVKTVVERAERATARGDYAAATPCIPACLFCARRGACHKLHEVVLKVAQKYHPIEFPDDIDVTRLRDPQQFSWGMRLQQVVSAWAEGYRQRGTDQVLLGKTPVPEGFELKTTTTRKVESVFRFARLARKFLTRGQFRRTLKVRLGAVEDAISDLQPRGNKKAVVSQFQQALKEAGAVKDSPPVVYLKACPKKQDKLTN